MSAGFQFKQFYVRHDRCAMKVGTDSIMLGSWAEPGLAQHILDIGSGSGVLSLIMAQKSVDSASVLGIDLDEDAVQQATENAQSSPWHSKVRFAHQDAATYQPKVAFDLIISNPPYYVPKQGDLTPGEAQYIAPQRRQARHTLALTHHALLQTVKRALSPKGRFVCVLPMDYANLLLEVAVVHGLHCARRTDVRSTLRKPLTRSLLELGPIAKPCESDTLTIHHPLGGYSDEYRALCQDFYLDF